MARRNQNIRSQEVQDILTRVPNKILIWSNSIILLLIIVFLIATWFIKYPDVISGETKITSVNPIYKAVANHAGLLDSIFVKENEVVSQGQILAVIKNNASLSDVTKLKKILDSASLRADHLSISLDSLPLLRLGELSSSFALFENEYFDFRLRNSLQYYSNQNGHRLSISSLVQRMELLKEQKGLEIQNIALEKRDFERYEALFKDGAIAENEYENRKVELQNKEKNLKNIDISISQLRQSLDEAKRASSESDILRALEKSQSFKNTIHALTQLKEDIRSWEEKYLIKSEIDGMVSLIEMRNQHQKVLQGDHICSIIPSEIGGFIARLKAPATNSGKIKKGQKVNIKLNNYPETEYGFILGNVSSISSLPSPEGHYWVEVILPSKLKTSYNIEIPFQLEMSGTAEIITEDLRLFERFFYRLKGIIS